MAYDLVHDTTTIFSTDARFGTYSVNPGSGLVATAAMPAGTTFRVRISVKSTATTTQIAASSTGMFWLGASAGLLHAEIGAGTYQLSSAISLSDNLWHDLDLRVSPTLTELYCDGVYVTGSTVNGNTATTSPDLVLGRLGSGYNWSGLIDEAALSTVIPAHVNYTPSAISNSEVGLIALYHFENNYVNSQGVAVAATAITTTGPTSGVSGFASTAFTVGANGTITGTVIVTPNDSSGGGTFTPTTVSISSGTPTGTFTYTPSSAGAKTIGSTNNGSLTPPATITYTASAAPVAATAITLSGPPSGNISTASTAFTVGANGTITGTVIVTPSASDGTFTPSTVSISSGTPTATFTYTPATTGAKTVSVANNGSLTNPSGAAYTVASGPLYVRVDATDLRTGQSIMVLVPSTGSANPYNSANPTPVVLHSHGMSDDQTAILGSDKLACTTAMLNAGYIVAGSNTHGANWGSQVAVDDLAALDQYVRANYNVSNVALWSQSMGGVAGLLAIAQSKVKGVVGWLGTYPACNLSNIYGLGTYTGYINTSYGITGTGIYTYANQTYGNDPVLLPATGYKHVPVRFYASPSDTAVPKANNSDVLAALVAGSSRENTIVVCSGAHGDPSHFQPADYVSFLARCFATPIALTGSLGAITPTTTKTIAVTFQTKAGALQASLTGLKWEWQDVLGTVIDSGTGATTNASGVFSITSVHTNLASGGVGYLKVTNSNGVVNTTDVSFNGAVAVA